MIEWAPQKMDGRRTRVPEHLRAGLTRYVEQGVEPGSGLRAILEDRPLSQIVGYCDTETDAALGNIYRFLYNAVGSPAWGSPERVAAWIAHNGMQGQ